MMKIFLLIGFIFLLYGFLLSQSRETNILIADGTLSKPAKAVLQPEVIDLTFNEIGFVGKTVMQNDVNFDLSPQTSFEEPKISIEFALLDAAEGFFISREVKSRAYLYTAYSKKMNRNYQGIMVLDISSNSTKFAVKAHYVYQYSGDKYLRQISDMNGNFLSELAIFSEHSNKKDFQRMVRIVEFSPDNLQTFGSAEIYRKVPQKQKTPVSLDKTKPAKRIFIPPIETAVKIYVRSKTGIPPIFLDENWVFAKNSWIRAKEPNDKPAALKKDLINYVEIVKPVFPKSMN